MHALLKLFFIILLLDTESIAQETQELDYEDHRLINLTTLEFNVCVQQNAAEQLNSNVDVKEIAGHAVNHCDSKLDEIREKLGSKMNPVTYSGLERHIKNRAIKKLLLQLMYQRSAQDSNPGED